MDKLKLHGFNNLTKSLSFNIYDICYAKTPQHRKEYIEYIDDRPFNDKRYYISNQKLKDLGWSININLETGVNNLLLLNKKK